jgi:hypothetical protein
MTVDAGPQQISVGSSHAQMGEMLIPPIGRALSTDFRGRITDSFV